MAITNDDKIGNLFVRILAVKRVRRMRDKDGLPTGRIYARSVSCFQTRDLENAKEEARREILSKKVNGRRGLLLSETEYDL